MKMKFMFQKSKISIKKFNSNFLSYGECQEIILKIIIFLGVKKMVISVHQLERCYDSLGPM